MRIQALDAVLEGLRLKRDEIDATIEILSKVHHLVTHDGVLTTRQVANILGIQPATLVAWKQRGLLPLAPRAPVTGYFGITLFWPIEAVLEAIQVQAARKSRVGQE